MFGVTCQDNFSDAPVSHYPSGFSRSLLKLVHCPAMDSTKMLSELSTTLTSSSSCLQKSLNLLLTRILQ
jgi:hypothetical protein